MTDGRALWIELTLKYQEGYQARLAGKPFTAKPAPPLSENGILWAYGWADGGKALQTPMKARRPKRKINDRRRIFPMHQAFVRTHRCLIRGCGRTPVVPAHLRTAANSGTGLKPRDSWVIPLCQYHHDRAHQRGHATVAEENGMTLDQWFEAAAWLAQNTTDQALRAAMQERPGGWIRG